MAVRASNRAYRVRISVEKQALAIVTPAPIRLARRGWRRVILDENVVPTSFAVRTSGRTFRTGIPAEEQTLALAAPAPILLRVSSAHLFEYIVPAAILTMSSSGRALRTRMTCKEKTLTFMAPTPVGLPGSGRIVLDQGIVSAAHRMLSAGRTLGARVITEEQTLALVTPAPMGLAGGVGIQYEDIVSTSIMRVRTASRAFSAGCSAGSRTTEEEAFTLRTPAPLFLPQDRVVRSQRVTRLRPKGRVILIFKLDRDGRTEIVWIVPEHSQIEVQMRARGMTCVSGKCDDLTLENALIFDRLSALVFQMIVSCGGAICVPDQDCGTVTGNGGIIVSVAVMVFDEGDLPTACGPHDAAYGVHYVKGVRLPARSVTAGGVVPIPTAVPQAVILKWKPVYCHK
jgi:hypothetical protein